MREVHVGSKMALGRDTIEKLRLNSPVGGWFPASQTLVWYITERTLPYADLFFSEQLERIVIYPLWQQRRRTTDGPDQFLSSVASTFSTLLVPSGLRLLIIAPRNRAIRHKIAWGYFKDSVSSLVLRCGPSLTNFGSVVPMSDEAIIHLLSLPKLRNLHFDSPPPHHSLFQSLIFPPLTGCLFTEDAATRWLSMFQQLEDAVRGSQGITPLGRMKDALKTLRINDYDGTFIDITLTTPLLMFRNLTRLNVDIYCPQEECSFELNDTDVKTLAMALPQLKGLILGHPCQQNTCDTTITCLLFISIYCIKLEQLEVHFNTLNISEDREEMLESPGEEMEQLLSLPKCALKALDVHEMPLALAAFELEEVCDGLTNIFPSLERVQSKGVEGSGWDEVSQTLR